VFHSQSQVSTEGKDFWLGFMQNADDGNLPSSLEIYFTSRTVANVVVYGYTDDRTREFTVQPGVTQTIIVNTAVNNPYAAIGSGAIETKAIHITSDVDISVYALNARRFSADAAVILPTLALGREYFVAAHMEPANDREEGSRESELLVVATEDNTTIEITTPVDAFGGFVANTPKQIKLDRGEIYQIQSLSDLSGTYIESVGADPSDCKNIAVFGGNVFTNVGGCGAARDHLYEQMFPVSAWGKNFLFVPYKTRQGGDYVKIIAAEDDTRITISGINGEIVLGVGEIEIFKTLDGVRSISSNKPITVAQFSRSQACDGVDSDPFMIILSPLEQRLKAVTFNAFEVEVINNYYLTLITKSDALRGIILDNIDITDQFIVEGNAAYASIDIAQGNHVLVAPEGVIAYVYGFGNVESFGYSAGASLANLNATLVLEDEFINLVNDTACLNAEIDFTIDFEIPAGQEPRYDTFDWHFDDGTTISGQNVKHTYTTAGVYDIILIASKGAGSCGTSETFNRVLTVQEVEVEVLTGPESVCPDVFDIAYELKGAAGNTYDWFISPGDGAITQGQGTERILVDWASPNNNAFIKVLPRNALGCVSDTLTLPVKINKLLEPALPEGPADVCFDDFLAVKYSTPTRNGSQFFWEIEGGRFLPNANSNTSNEVTVQWDGVGAGRIWYLESNTLIDDCDGTSDPLSVTIYTEVSATESITNVSCNGFSDGSITLIPSGGKPGDYTVAWDNGQTGLTATGLIAGDYLATITDAANCTAQFTYIVTEPEVLEITGATIFDVRCFEETNGMISMTAIGGTTNAQGLYNYRVVGVGIDRIGTNSNISNLPNGVYTVTVIDAQGCEVSEEYTINEPPPLMPIIESLINEPICPQASNGTTFIEAMGGSPDYQFYWSNNPTTEAQDGSGFSQGSYSVRIEDASGCETTLDFDVVERYPRLFIPNAFSPNNDGINDEFKPVTDCDLNYNIQIFNSWGGIVFASADITEGWDGRFNGQKVQDGQYSYIIFYSGAINGVNFEETRRGSVKVFR
jgi:gliding motility-associated-like protein